LLDAKVPQHLKDDAALLLSAVREAGALGLQLSKQGVRHWNKPDGSVVTEADLQIDALLKQRLHGARAHYGWLSEESIDTPARLACERLWVLDPIDGTQSFVNGTDGWCIGIALVEGARPILSVLLRPMVDELYWAVAGGGAYCNSRPLNPHDEATLDNAALLATGRAAKILLPYGVKGQNAPQIPLLLRLAFVASGKTDIALSFGNKNDWDLAAGDLLMQEAGARLTDLDGRQMLYNKPQPWQNGMVAAGVQRHRAVLAQLEAL
jgi:myo-inositol-1(or 4)-monophosphatase